MARKYVARFAIQHGDTVVRAGTEFPEGDPFLEGREEFFRAEGEPDPEPEPEPKDDLPPRPRQRNQRRK